MVRFLPLVADQGAVESKLAEGCIIGDLVGRQHVHGGKQVEVTAFLTQIGGRQIDGDAFGRQRQAHGSERRAPPLTALPDRLVGQPDNGKRRQPGTHLHLDIDVQHRDATKGYRVRARDQINRPYFCCAIVGVEILAR